MVRKLLSLLVIVSTLLTLSACGGKPVSPTESVPVQSTAPQIDPTQSIETTAPTEAISTTTPTETTAPQSTTPPETTAPQSTALPETKPTNPSGETKPAETEPVNQETQPVTPIPPQVETPAPTYGHTSLAQTEYYQYTLMTTAEKQLYQQLVAGIQNLQGKVNVTGISIHADDGLELFYKVLADHPEFFFVSRRASVIYNPRTMNVQSFVILYTDGEKADATDGNNNPVVVADRTKIAAKRTALENKIAEILKTIPANYSEVDREKLFYDYIVSHVIYDTVAAATPTPVDSILPHAYDIYGAAVDGKAVCEGYAKLFQLLCYRTGINATQISGTANGGGHMWNAVKLEGDWYEIDVTWGDGAEGLVLYEHFNLAHAQMSKDHTADNSVIPYPACNGTKYSYADYYALKVLNATQLSDNYKLVVDRLIAAGSGYMILYKNGVSLTGADYNTLVYSDTAPINRYARQRGYRLELAHNYTTYGEYVYFAYRAVKQ